MKNKKITYNGLNLRKDYELKLKHVSVMNFNKKITNRINGSHCSEIYYIIEGNCHVYLQEHEEKLSKGDILLISNRSAHVILEPINCNLKYLVVGLDGISISPEWDSEHLDTPYILYSLDLNSKLHNYFDELMAEAVNRKPDYQIVSNHLANIIVIQLERELIAKFYPTTSKRNYQECEQLKEYIDKFFYKDIHLNELASMVYMDKYHLVHEFKKYCGTTPINYLVDQRIEHCKILLENSDFTMEEIALHVGFNSQSYFNQMFKKRVGMTPSQYKKDYR